MKSQILSKAVLGGSLILLAGCIGDKSGKSNINDPEVEVLETHKVCKLSEDIPLGNLESFSFIDSFHFVIASNNPPMLTIYDTEGTQKNTISNIGKGPHEFIDISIVMVHNRKIYTWCNKQLKLIVFDEMGHPLKEYKGFKRAIRDFSIAGDIVVFYTTGGFKDAFIEIYDLKKEITLNKLGEVTNEHLLLDIMKNAGGLSIIDSMAYFTSGSELGINQFDLQSAKLQSYKFKDPEFKVERVKREANDIVNNNWPFVMKYMHDNSIVTDILANANSFLIKAEVGRYVLDNKKLDLSKRYFKYYLIEDKMVLKKIYKCPITEDNQNELLCRYGEKFYTLRRRILDNDIDYTLEVIHF